jgi:prepilin-type N-terminal cleavage/methylation domain-containing protein/prepilin-type processing-associated H-X9-DG protein
MVRRAFTLVELLVVLAILLVVAGVLFPVFAAAKARALTTQCASQFKQVSQATLIYTDDYDQRYMPINHQVGGTPSSENDRTWVQLLLPYRPGFDQFFCPENRTGKSAISSTFDADLVAGDTSSRYYTASQKVNLGYNFQYLSPVVRERTGWAARTRSQFDVQSSASTILFVDSAVQDAETGQVTGGSWLVVPPCRYSADSIGRAVDTFTGSSAGNTEVYTPSRGWEGGSENVEFRYGGAWTWHAGRMTVAMLDGSVRSFSPGDLTRGCNFQANWQGFIQNSAVYKWDLN